MPTVVGWRLYYADGSTVDANQMPWPDAPREGVQVLVVFYDTFDNNGRPGRGLFHGSPGNAGDYYWQYGAGTWKDVPSLAMVKYGKMMEEKADWLAIYNTALNDYQWP